MKPNNETSTELRIFERFFAHESALTRQDIKDRFNRIIKKVEILESENQKLKQL